MSEVRAAFEICHYTTVIIARLVLSTESVSGESTQPGSAELIPASPHGDSVSVTVVSDSVTQ